MADIAGGTTPRFLEERQPVRPRLPLPAELSLRGIYFRRQSNQAELEIMVLDGAAEPKAGTLRAVWRERQAYRPAPVLVVALCGEQAWLFGPDTDKRPVRRVPVEQAERLCRRALAMPDQHAALRFLADSLPGLDSDLPGIRNEGLLSEHELRRSVCSADAWTRAQAKGAAVLGSSGLAMLRRLNFGVEKADGVTSLLTAGERQRAVAVLLDDTETLEDATPRFQALSPVAWALNAATRRSLPWVVMVQEDRIRLYPVDLGVGVGERGRTDTWIELRLALMRRDQAALLWLTVSADALAQGGTLETLLANSRRFAADLAVRLRERIYDRVVPRLAAGIAAARAMTNPTPGDLRLTYGMALVVLFRLLFIAYAEDRDFLPYASNSAYRDRALKKKALELARTTAPAGTGPRIWNELRQLFGAVRSGDAALGVPAYGGGLFTADPAVSPAGAALESVVLPDSVFVPVLQALLLDETRDLGDPGRGPMDFRSLRVREFGTIYEGLLESELAVADTDLALKRQGNELVYLPATAKDAVEVPRGGIFLHNRSGARKSSGSYFTPGFVVDHLLDAALEPALQAHVDRLRAMDETGAAAVFFDIRIADIAMGSGHFLVAALDRVERTFSAMLTERPLPGVIRELDALRQAAESTLHGLGQPVRIQNGQVLRRLIARRCLYGVDLNPLAVDLARLSIWVHTFVPGLPLSLLDHALVQGNALTGVASLRQAGSQLRALLGVGIAVEPRDMLLAAEPHLRRLAAIADTTPEDVEEARRSHEAARNAVGAAASLFDAGTSNALGNAALRLETNKHIARLIETGQPLDLRETPVYGAIRAAPRAAQPLHLPLTFPEVFLRHRPGFDVVVGNPPWDKARVEKHEFWARHFPGLRGMGDTGKRDAEIHRLEQSRPDLVKLESEERSEAKALRDAVRALPGMNTGHPDLFRAFMARFGQLLAADGGRYGVVLPGDAFKIRGNGPVRDELDSAAASVDVQLLTNRAEWIFEGVHPRKLIALVAVEFEGQSTGECRYALRPEHHREASLGNNDTANVVHRGSTWLRQYSAGLVQPTLPTASAEASIAVIDAMMRAPKISAHPRLKVRRVYADVETTRDKAIYGAPPDSPETWPVYGGDSFGLWQPDTGKYYALTMRSEALKAVQRKRTRSPASSPYGAMPRAWREDPASHHSLRPRVAFRNITNRTNQRTLLTALVPGCRILVETAPWVLWLTLAAQQREEAFLLGVMCSVCCDWWMRRFVEGHVDEEAFNSLRVPDSVLSSGPGTRVVALAGRLACPDERFAEWARAVGVAHGPLDEDQKQATIEELDAIVARLYGLSPDQLIHVFDTFHEWPSERQAREWAGRRDRTVSILRALP